MISCKNKSKLIFLYWIICLQNYVKIYTLAGTVTLKNQELTLRNPWLVVFSQKIIQSQPTRILCSGTIISSHLILTSAQCFYDPDLYNPDQQVEIYTAYNNPHFYITTIDHSNIFIHHLYSSNHLIVKANDLAIIKIFNQDLEIYKNFETDFLVPILVSEGKDIDMDLELEGRYFSLEKSLDNFENYEKWQEVKIIGNDNCLSNYRVWAWKRRKRDFLKIFPGWPSESISFLTTTLLPTAS